MENINIVELTLTFIRSVGSILTNLVSMLTCYLPLALVPLFIMLFVGAVVFRVIGRD